MTTVTSTAAARTPETGPRGRFRDLLAAEWLKLWSLRSTPWSLLAGAVAVMAFNAGAAWDHYRYWDASGPDARAGFVTDGMPLRDAFTANAALVLLLALGAIGAAAVTGEYGTGMIRATFAAVPARRSLMAAKACVVTAVATLFGVVVAGGSFLLTQAILDARDAGVSLGHPGATRVVAASALLAPVAALAGLALGALIRHGAATAVACFAVLLLLPAAVQENRRWAAVLDHALPLGAWNRLVAVEGFPPGPYPWTTSGAWTVYAAWALAGAALAVAAVHHRDQ
ncbi:ABC transporter permease [Streptomyces albus]|uniref:ABC transporter permease n=1 Tax=Streptomyces albus TaxID=1888 RepID=UPI0004CB9D52|nr:ABC transporter permease [Streptomyces albus]